VPLETTQVREGLPTSFRAARSDGSSPKMTLAQLGQDRVDALWAAFHACIEPISRAGKLGAVVFQFHLNFSPSVDNRLHVRWCREKLDKGLAMAVEFRNRDWFGTPDAAKSLVAWLSEAGIVLIAADELRHETFQSDRAQTGLPAGATSERLPIALEATVPSWGSYVRVHRRHGGFESRVLPATDIQAWVVRLRDSLSAPRVNGPIWFLWGTDWEDAPLVNARHLTAELLSTWPRAIYDYKAARAATSAKRKGSLLRCWALPDGSGAPPPPPPPPPQHQDQHQEPQATKSMDEETRRSRCSEEATRKRTSTTEEERSKKKKGSLDRFFTPEKKRCKLQEAPETVVDAPVFVATTWACHVCTLLNDDSSPVSTASDGSTTMHPPPPPRCAACETPRQNM
jgi:uncharacterized protein YecE (DUF72 family)